MAATADSDTLWQIDFHHSVTQGIIKMRESVERSGGKSLRSRLDLSFGVGRTEGRESNPPFTFMGRELDQRCALSQHQKTEPCMQQARMRLSRYTIISILLAVQEFNGKPDMQNLETL